MIMQTPQVKKTLSKGKFGENLALKYLHAKDYKLLHANFYIRGGELDLITQKDGIIVFVEVKLRSGEKFGTPVEALTHAKKRKLVRTIFTFLGTLPYYVNWQLDLVAIDYDAKKNTAYIQHLANILDT